MEEPYPAITSGDGERGYATGYALRKVVHSTVSIMPMAVVIRQLYVSVRLRLC